MVITWTGLPGWVTRIVDPRPVTSATTSTDGIVFDRNEVFDRRTGQSESVVLNGNVVKFVVRNNVVHDCNNIGMISNNVLYENDTMQDYSGQVAIQFHFEDNTFKNNIVWANPDTLQMIVHYVEGGTAAQRAFPAGNVFDYNVYFASGNPDPGDIEFGLIKTAVH